MTEGLIRGGRLSGEGAARVAAVAGSGGTILFPTDTYYALGADPLSQDGLGKIFRLKKRPAGRPLLILIDDVGAVDRFAVKLSATHRALMERFWPGPLTLLFPARDGLPGPVVSPSGEVALRVPGNAVCREILRAAGGALTGTSANRSGEPPPRSPAEALSSLAAAVDLVVDGGTLRSAEVSTLLGVADGEISVLREGAVRMEDIEIYLGGKENGK